MKTWEVVHGHVLDMLATLPEGVARCCVTSPPFWGLRAYGTEPQVWLPDGIGPDEHRHAWRPILPPAFRGPGNKGPSTKGYEGNHYATFPTAVVEPCILAGSAPGDLVVDPFCGSGTVGLVARRHGRRFWGSELLLDYVQQARGRLEGPLFTEEA